MNLGWRLPAALVALACAALIVGYSAVTPAFEAPDEPGHFRYVEMLASGRGLPVQGSAGDFDPEFSQPPLYYAVESLLARAIPSPGAPVPDYSAHNPYQNTTAAGNVNLYRHPPTETFPWTGGILQLHAMRLLNLPFAAITLGATFGIGLELGLSPLLAVAAAAVLGLLPQFDFIAGALNADNAVTAAAALALYLLPRSMGRPPSVRAGLLLGLVAAAAMLSKLSGLAVLPLAIGLPLWRAWRERKPAFLAQASVTAAVTVTLAGWWYARNLSLYGDPLGWQPMLTAIGAMLRPRPLTPFQAAAALARQAPTALAVFGWNNLRLPLAVYAAAGAMAALALAGAVPLPPRRGRLGEGTPPQRFVLVLLWIALFAASLIRWVEVNTDAAQWRLLFPAFPALAVLLVLGLSRLAPAVAAVAPAALAGLSAASLLIVLRPAYMPDPAYNGPIQHELHAPFGGTLELVGYDAPQYSDPGQPVALTLYWRALQPPPMDDVVHLAAVDAASQPALQESTWPEYGRAPTSGWQRGQIVPDRHLLAAPKQPGAYTVYLDVFQPLPDAPRLSLETGGTTLALGRFLVPPPQTGAAPSPAANFGGSLALLQWTYNNPFGQPVQPLQVTLDWQVTARLQRDYTVFVHLLDGSGKVVSQSDSQPAGGRFPTSLLPAGLRVQDAHTLPVTQVPEGNYHLEIGVYDAQSGARLKIQGTRTDALTVPVVVGR